MKKFISIAITVFLLSLICSSYAGATNYDYGDAVGYGVAKHKTAEWQRLGTDWDSESSQKNPDNYDDGVRWSVNGGGWNTWGNDILNVKQGDKVKFEFTFTRALYGNHPYDDLSAWIDWNGDGDWADAGENIYFNRVDKGTTQIDDATYIADVGHNRYDSESMTFTTGDILVSGLFTGTTWLRARVSCSESIIKYNNNNGLDSDTQISSTGRLWQGETEDYRMNVSTVPIPGAVWLLGSGLLGLIGVRRRRK